MTENRPNYLRGAAGYAREIADRIGATNASPVLTDNERTRFAMAMIPHTGAMRFLQYGNCPGGAL